MSALDAARRLRRTRWWALLLRPAIFLLASALVARVIVSLVGSVDWQQVRVSLGGLDWADLPPLAALLLLRQGFNSVPLYSFIPSLGYRRAFQGDLIANLAGTVAPPPGDVVARVANFRSWGIRPVDAMPGVTLNSLVFYAIRFSMPILGVVFLLEHGLSAAQAWAAVLSLLAAVAIIVGLVLLARGEGFARLLGWQSARVAAWLGADADSAEWAAKVSAFRARMSERLMNGLPASLAALTAMVVCDGYIVVASLRVMGVDESTLPLLVILGSFFVAYVLTALPLAGLGVLDAALVVALTDVAGAPWEPAIVSALVIWRVVTLLGTLALGGIAYATWQWQVSTGRLLGATPDGP